MKLISDSAASFLDLFNGRIEVQYRPRDMIADRAGRKPQSRADFGRRLAMDAATNENLAAKAGHGLQDARDQGDQLPTFQLLIGGRLRTGNYIRNFDHGNADGTAEIDVTPVSSSTWN